MTQTAATQVTQTNLNVSHQESITKRIVFLDFLRIFAFTSVLVGHKFYIQIIDVYKDQNVHGTLRDIIGFLLHFIAGGGAGVVVFFLVSGYIIMHVLQNEKPLDFFVKRIFRIYPLLMIAVLLEAIYKYQTGDTSLEWRTLIPQMLLIGDFFGTQYALAGVEWTLRVEIMFYLFMLILKSVKIIDGPKFLLPWVLVLATYTLATFAPFPATKFWANGYFTIYGPFLFLGSMWYLLEKNKISLTFFSVYLIYLILQHYNLIEAHQTYWLKAPFATYAVVLFGIAWLYRDKLTITPIALLLSELTYAVYLFHNWIWNLIKLGVNKLGVSFVHPNVQIIIVLLIFCYLMVILVERPGIRLGKRVLQQIKHS